MNATKTRKPTDSEVIDAIRVSVRYGVVTVAAVVDRLEAAGVTVAETHAALLRLRAADRVTLEVSNDPGLLTADELAKCVTDAGRNKMYAFIHPRTS